MTKMDRKIEILSELTKESTPFLETIKKSDQLLSMTVTEVLEAMTRFAKLAWITAEHNLRDGLFDRGEHLTFKDWLSQQTEGGKLES